MQEKIIFREMLSELKRYADSKRCHLTTGEVKEFFENAHLEEEQFQFIYEYLRGQNIVVEGMENSLDRDWIPGEVGQRSDQGGMTGSALKDVAGFKGVDDAAYVDEHDVGEKVEDLSALEPSFESDVFFDMYRKDLANVVTVSEELELALCVACVQGDALAKSELVEHYLRFVCEIVSGYHNKELSKSDLVQEGNIGLILAIDTMDMYDSLGEFREYIRESILHALDDAELEQHDLKNQDQQVAERVNHVNEAIRNLEEELEHQVSLEELSGYLEMPMEEIIDILKMAGDEIELDEEEDGENHNH